MASLQLFVCFCLYQALPAFAQSATKKCLPDKVVLTNLENQYGVKISELDLKIKFDRLDIVGEIVTKNVTKILLGSADVVVVGHVYPKENYTDSKIRRNFNINSVDVQLAEKESEKEKKLVSCKVVGGEYSSKRQDHRSRSNLSPKERIEFVLNGLTEACLEIQICEYLNTVLLSINEYQENKPTVTRKLRNRPRIEEKSLQENKPTVTRKLRNRPRIEEKSLQSTINSLLDFGIPAALDQIVDSKGIFHLPEVKTSFAAAGSTGDFEAKDGIFEGLTTMKRVGDMVFTNVKNNYTVGTTVRLSKAKVTLPSYNGRYGYINIYGHVILDIDGASLTVDVSVDYNSRPCEIRLNELKIHDIGDIGVDITGFGWPLNCILKPVIRNLVRTKLLEQSKETLTEQAKQLNCEKYRPPVEMMLN